MERTELCNLHDTAKVRAFVGVSCVPPEGAVLKGRGVFLLTPLCMGIRFLRKFDRNQVLYFRCKTK